jgi:hypothetical protein
MPIATSNPAVIFFKIVLLKALQLREAEPRIIWNDTKTKSG